MKLIRKEFTEDIKQIKVKFIGDVHIGSKKCNYQLLVDTITEVANTENMYAIIMGDLINNSTKTSVGDVYSEALTPMEQVQRAVKLLMPIKDKILGITSGNHERRSYKTDGVDLMYFVASELGLQEAYDYAGVFLVLSNKAAAPTSRLHTTIYCTHGDGNGGKLIGGKANGLAKRGNILPNADVIVTGHTHTPITFKQAYLFYDEHHQKIVTREQLCINTSAFLNYEEYAELYGMQPSSSAQPVLVIGVNGDRKCLL